VTRNCNGIPWIVSWPEPWHDLSGDWNDWFQGMEYRRLMQIQAKKFDDYIFEEYEEV